MRFDINLNETFRLPRVLYLINYQSKAKYRLSLSTEVSIFVSVIRNLRIFRHNKSTKRPTCWIFRTIIFLIKVKRR